VDDPVEFLDTVWDAQPQDGSVYLAWMKGWSGGRGNYRQKEVHSANWDGYIPHAGVDVYFSPTIFSGQRTNAVALPGVWLYADLDEVHPRRIESTLCPTIAWETSQGRYQALWKLREAIRPNLLAGLNKALTYYLGADKSGWALNKVLRVPGTTNNKRGKSEQVHTLWDDGPTYPWKQIRAITGYSKDPIWTPTDENIPATEWWRNEKRANLELMSPSTRTMLRQGPGKGVDRSSGLFKLVRKLYLDEVGRDAMFRFLRNTEWNKFRNDQELWRDINRICQKVKNKEHERARSKKEKVLAEDPGPASRIRVVDHRAFMDEALPMPKWAVEHIWSDEAHGFIAGTPKSYKTLIALDLAVSVASATPFLNRFPVPEKGPVLFIQAENSPAVVQDRVRKIANDRGLEPSGRLNGKTGVHLNFGEDLPIGYVNNPDLNLRNEDDLNLLVELAGERKPRLMIFDPWYTLTSGIEENSAKEVGVVLTALAKIKRMCGTGIMLVHHFRKANDNDLASSAFDRISGSGVFGRWFQSALLVERSGERHTTTITPVHREQPDSPSVHAQFTLGEFGTLDYDCETVVMKEEAKSDFALLRDTVRAEPGIEIRSIAERTGIDKQRIRRMIEKGSYRVARLNTGRPGAQPLGVWLTT
jgi:AAA domain/RepB DNA-primase from phage plasmid